MAHLPLSKQKREGLGFGSIWNAFETHLGTGRARPAGCWPPRGGERQLAPPAKPVVLVDGVKLVDYFFLMFPWPFPLPAPSLVSLFPSLTPPHRGLPHTLPPQHWVGGQQSPASCPASQAALFDQVLCRMRVLSSEPVGAGLRHPASKGTACGTLPA